jgi:hypothetical protein
MVMLGIIGGGKTGQVYLPDPEEDFGEELV